MRALRRLAVAATAFTLLSATAHGVVVITIPSNEFFEYFATPTAVTLKGGPLYLVNSDMVEHSVTSYALRPDGSGSWCPQFDPGQCPLFWSEPVAQGLTEVLGLAEAVEGMQYQFYCGVHPTMHGSLLVAGVPIY